jgi:hypothetical protein
MVSHGNEYRAPTEAENAAIDELMRSVRDGGDGRTGGPAAAPSTATSASPRAAPSAAPQP